MWLKCLIVFHVLGACVWVGGHLVLALSVLPKALKEKNADTVHVFETHYERIGIPALVIQVITGLLIAANYVPVTEWFLFSDSMHIHVGIKLILLLITFMLAIHARLFIIPKLSAETLPSLAMHIIAITIVAVVMLFAGLNFRLGIIS
ncbi:MAG: copper resistance protein CopD [Chitinophagales bacterium]